MAKSALKPSARGWMIWVVVALFYHYELILRIVPSVMVTDLMRSLYVTATGIGAFSAFYYYAYTPLQLPIGILIDRFGSRFQLLIACFLCAIGSYLFSIAESDFLFAFSRLLIGFGSAYAWVGLVYLISHWFPSHLMGLLVGLGSSIGLLGGIIGQGPMVTIVETIGWRDTNLYLALIGLLIAFLLWFIVREAPKVQKKSTKKTTFASAFTGFKSVIANTQSWICALFSLSLYLSISVFAELWGISFLQSAYGLSSTGAGWGTSLIYTGMLFGGPIIGFLSDYTRRRKLFILIGAAGAALTIGTVILSHALSLKALYTLLFLFGFFTGSQLLAFSIAIEVNPSFSKGSALAFNNFMSMVGGMIMQPLVGWLLDMRWSGAGSEAVRIYSAHDFRLALSTLPISCVVGFILATFIRETHCKNIDGKEHHFESHSD